MNKSIIMGRLCKDPDIRTTQSQTLVATFTLAVDRRFKNANGEKQADFIPVVAWKKQAEFIRDYVKKGAKIIVIGSIQTRIYDDKDGKKVYVTEIVADELEFAESKKDDNQSEHRNEPEDDTSLPFDL